MIALRNGQIKFVLAPSAPIPLSVTTPLPASQAMSRMQPPASLTTPRGDVIHFPNCTVTKTGSGFASVDSGAGRVYLAKINTPCGNGFRFFYRGNIRELKEILRDVPQYEATQENEVRETPLMAYDGDAIIPVQNGG